MNLEKPKVNYKRIIEYVYYAVLLIAVILAGSHYQNLSDAVSDKPGVTPEEMGELHHARDVLEWLCALVMLSLLIRYFKIRNKRSKIIINN